MTIVLPDRRFHVPRRCSEAHGHQTFPSDGRAFQPLRGGGERPSKRANSASIASGESGSSSSLSLALSRGFAGVEGVAGVAGPGRDGAAASPADGASLIDAFDGAPEASGESAWVCGVAAGAGLGISNDRSGKSTRERGAAAVGGSDTGAGSGRGVADVVAAGAAAPELAAPEVVAPEVAGADAAAAGGAATGSGALASSCVGAAGARDELVRRPARSSRNEASELIGRETGASSVSATELVVSVEALAGLAGVGWPATGAAVAPEPVFFPAVFSSAGLRSAS